ncbi:hypothetical protein OG234_13355 [Streptomyces sp. NBC_01420]|uniref:hypothetical protein n=1 Tax=Streptomyces sp. NBC_01420 TaxID=2903858 RepID=UPI003246A78B
MTATITAHAAAAGRARDLAELITRRSPLHPAEDALLAIADLLTTAAQVLEMPRTPNADGTAPTPPKTVFALADAQTIALAHPTAGISDHVMYYVTAPITGQVPPLGELNPVSTQRARQETRLRNRIAAVAAELTTVTDDDTRYEVLEALLHLHHKFDRLSDSVALDNARPCNRR